MFKEYSRKITKALGNGNKAYGIGQIIGIVAILFIILFLTGAALIFGLNMMGLQIDYTMKTCLGGALVVFMLKPSGKDLKSDKEIEEELKGKILP